MSSYVLAGLGSITEASLVMYVNISETFIQGTVVRKYNKY